jgi:hypothetical protein
VTGRTDLFWDKAVSIGSLTVKGQPPMPLSLSAEERMSFLLSCPKCGKYTEKPVAWLAAHERLPCATPACGSLIDLQSETNRDLIEMLSDYCVELDEHLK